MEDRLTERKMQNEPNPDEDQEILETDSEPEDDVFNKDNED